MFKKDHYVLGLAIGILCPIVLFGLLYGINWLLLLMGVAKHFVDIQTHVLVSLFGNLIPIRYYFVNLKFDKTGRGVLIITFATVLIFFAFKDSLFNLS